MLNTIYPAKTYKDDYTEKEVITLDKMHKEKMKLNSNTYNLHI